MTARSTTDDRNIGRLIAHHRKRKGILQRELAEAIGVCAPQVSRYERGHEYVSLAKRAKVAEALGLDPMLLADPALEEVTPDERDLLESYRRIGANAVGKASIHRVMAAIETARETAPC